MTNEQLLRIIRESSLALGHEIDPGATDDILRNVRTYDAAELPEFKRDLIESARKVNLTVFETRIFPKDLRLFLETSPEVVLLLKKDGERLSPVLIKIARKRVVSLLDGSNYDLRDFTSTAGWLMSDDGIICFAIAPYASLIGKEPSDLTKPLTPLKRLLRLLATEKKDIAYILVYAIIIGLVSLMLPIGLQTTVELISGGVFFSSVYVLIGLVIAGVLATGVLQVIQLTLVEHLQRKVFMKGAFEFAFRIPKIKAEALRLYYAPELVNRFFDITTIQKGLPKVLIDLPSACIQILFGLILMSLYHPVFVFFGLFLILVILVILGTTARRGLNSSIKESKYKYNVVQWLEEMARAIFSFKLMGNTDLPVRRTDHALSNYLKHRKEHFSVLMTQYAAFVFLKVAVTGALLILGTVLVVNREITLGQFVAAEVVIILVLSAVEKMIMYTEVVYDMLTAVEKVSQLTDLPLERSGGFDFPKSPNGSGYAIDLYNLNYKFGDSNERVLHDINLHIGKRERICIAGPGGSGKTTLANIISGLYTDYEGAVIVNGYSLRDLDLTHLRDKVAKNISQDDIFDGTLYENLLLGKAVHIDDAMHALEKVGLRNTVTAFPDGLQTRLISAGKGLSNSMMHKLILARCIAKKPELLILNDFFSGISKTDKLELMQCAIDPNSSWTLVAVSNDPMVMAACDRVVVLDQGRMIANDSFEQLSKAGIIQNYIE